MSGLAKQMNNQRVAQAVTGVALALSLGTVAHAQEMAVKWKGAPEFSNDDVSFKVREGEIHYDLAITDFSMPGMSGLDLARALHQLHPEREIALTTGYISNALRREAPAAGVSVLIDKPNTGDELIAAIDRLVARAQWRGPAG